MSGLGSIHYWQITLDDLNTHGKSFGKIMEAEYAKRTKEFVSRNIMNWSSLLEFFLFSYEYQF